MAKISVVPPENAREVPPADGAARTRTYFPDARAPLHLHLHEVAAGLALRLEPSNVDRVGFVWRGGIEAGGVSLTQGSSLIVEHGRALDIAGVEPSSLLLLFAAAGPASQARPGGHVHLLPAESAPRLGSLAEGSAVGGVMHADSACPSCEVWLHENHFPGGPPPSPEQQAAGVHSHTEDETIFVTDGQIRLGNKLYGPGTAVAIAADTLYSFTPGPEGLRFVNFRAATPGDIRFANGHSISETGYWRERLPRPRYIEVPA